MVKLIYNGPAEIFDAMGVELPRGEPRDFDGDGATLEWLLRHGVEKYKADEPKPVADEPEAEDETNTSTVTRKKTRRRHSSE